MAANASSWLVTVLAVVIAAGVGYAAARAGAGNAPADRPGLRALEARLAAVEQQLTDLARQADAAPPLTGIPGDVSPNVRDTLTRLHPAGHVVDHSYDPLGYWTFTVRSHRKLHTVTMCNGGDVVDAPPQP